MPKINFCLEQKRKSTYRLAIVTSTVCLLFSLYANAQFPAVDYAIKEQMKNQHISGLSIGIVKNGEVLLSKGYGYANLEASIPASETTIYKLGSISKQIIATCILTLVEQKKLKLSDPLYTFFENTPREWKGITIRHLLNHTSGLRREPVGFNWNKRQPDSILIKASFSEKLIFAPGTKWEYSNLGYFILAEIIRKTTKESFEDYMNNFFRKYNLNNTTTTTKNRKEYRTAIGYRYNSSEDLYNPIDFIALRPSGAFSSSIVDLVKWDLMMRKLILTNDSWSRMWEDTVRTGINPIAGAVSYYGYGWNIDRYFDQRLVSHSGSTLGFSTQYWKFIDNKISIIILCNTEDIKTWTIARAVYSALKTRG